MANNTSLYGSNGNVLPAGDNVIITGTLTVNGCAILTDCSTFNLLPFNATTVNVGGSATTLALGATTGVTTIQNQLATANYDFPVADGTANQILITDGAGNLSFSSISSLGVSSITGTANQVIASSPTGAVTLSLPQSIATTSSVAFGGLNVDSGVLYVDPTNNRVGVNTITPAYDLDVNGDIKVGGDTIFNSYNEKLIEYSQTASIYGTSRQANFQATNNIGVRVSYVFIDGVVEYNTNNLTTSATTPNQVLSFWNQTTIEAVKSTIKVISGGAVQCIEVLMVQDGTTISLNTYGDVRTAGNLTTVSSGYNAITGYWELRVTPVNAVTTYAVTNQIMY